MAEALVALLLPKQLVIESSRERQLGPRQASEESHLSFTNPNTSYLSPKYQRIYNFCCVGMYVTMEGTQFCSSYEGFLVFSDDTPSAP
jgi:hypothetical protein